eukprot:TRINITY_DN1457_c1_g1_i1.p1 TRINITY_DN1457_c1_g1~~TRINITY_DN1457_c1_g1_i1.p1  ORF type:complete len:286 (+),score=60.20 TRINITY_DN1457_c1_g1_i1:48-860(+)
MARPHHVAPPMNLTGSNEIRAIGSDSGMTPARPMQVGGVMRVGLPKPVAVNQTAPNVLRVGIPRPMGTSTSGGAPNPHSGGGVFRVGVPKSADMSTATIPRAVTAAQAPVFRVGLPKETATKAIDQRCVGHHADKNSCGANCQCGALCPCRPNYTENTRAHLTLLPFSQSPDIVMDLYATSHVPTVVITRNHPSWQPDSAAFSCAACYSSFTLFLRRHHCRGCGQVLCHKCCHKRSSQTAVWNQHRICTKCDQRITSFAQRLPQDPARAA